jgi:D-alanyl-D-alanine carboxypeptidase/D-alanyl-D-alanine-endopeptidase (penicillin-binding protein 4)
LRQHAINVTSESLDFGSTKNLQELLRYRSTHALDDIARNMLTYSTNFIANQLSLVWTAYINNKPANFEQFSERAMQRLRQSFGWQRFRLLEGAGLSRNNRLSARQLLDVVNALISYKELLPRYRDGVRAKTGTLNGVSSLAGVIDAAALPDASPAAKGNWHFAMLVNDETINDPSWREAVLDSLIERVRSASMSH